MTNDDNRRSNEDRQAVARGRNGPNVTLIGFSIVALLFVVFFLQNSDRTSIDFLVFEKNTTIRWSIIIAMLLGVVLDRVFSIWWRRRARRTRIDT